MHTDLQTTTQSYLGEKTMRAVVKNGCAPIALGIEALYENDYKPGELFSRKTLVACGIGADLAQTIINQCEGKEWNKNKSEKKKKVSKAKKLSMLETLELEACLEELEESNSYYVIRLIVDGMDIEDVPAHLRYLKSVPEDEFNPADKSAVRDLFFNYTYENGAEPLKLRERGGPARHARIPSRDELAKVFGVDTLDDLQKHYAISGQRTTRGFCDAFFKEWMRDHKPFIGKNKHSKKRLCSIFGESPVTVNARIERLGIVVENNFFSHEVNATMVSALLLRCRKGCHWELVLPEEKLEGISSGKHVREPRLHQLSEAGLGFAKKEWEKAGRPGRFMDCLRVYGHDVNSYTLPEDKPAAVEEVEVQPEPVQIPRNVSITTYNKYIPLTHGAAQ